MDGVAELRSGETFSNPSELKAVLLDRQDTFARGPTEKLLTYAAGRPMTYRDYEELERIANRALEEERGFRNLIIDISMSEVFTNR